MSAPPHTKNKTIKPEEKKTAAPAPAAPASGNTTYGAHATMPLLASDKYADINLPDLAEFDPEQIKLDATIVACGKRRTGKSWVFRNLMYLMKDKIPAGIVISQTDELNKFWRQYIPSTYIYPTYEPDILNAVFERQKKILNNPALSDAEKDAMAPFFVLLDDVISDQRLKYDPNIMELFVAGRHYRLFVLITTQYAKAITPTLRGNTDYLFLFKTVQQRQKEALYEDFGSFLTKDGFYQTLDAYTEDNECLVIDTSPENHVGPEEMMKWWKAIDPGPFQMGSKEYWESSMSEMHDVPPPDGPQSSSQLLTPAHIMPAPYNRWL
jgi:hypothetical protein